MRAAAALTATVGGGLGTPGVARTLVKHDNAGNAFERDASHTEPFWGAHQGGIITPPQSHTYLAALDLATEKRDEVMRLLRAWTTAAARMTRGEPPRSTERNAATVLSDSGEARGLPRDERDGGLLSPIDSLGAIHAQAATFIRVEAEAGRRVVS